MPTNRPRTMDQNLGRSVQVARVAWPELVVNTPVSRESASIRMMLQKLNGHVQAAPKSRLDPEAMTSTRTYLANAGGPVLVTEQALLDNRASTRARDASPPLAIPTLTCRAINSTLARTELLGTLQPSKSWKT